MFESVCRLRTILLIENSIKVSIAPSGLELMQPTHNVRFIDGTKTKPKRNAFDVIDALTIHVHVDALTKQRPNFPRAESS